MVKIGDKTKNRFKHSVRDLIQRLSRKVLVYKQPIKNECKNCYYDKMTGTSTGKCTSNTIIEADTKQEEWEQTSGLSFLQYKWFKYGRCPVCLGRGYLETKRRTHVDCLVTWNPDQRSFGNTLTFTAAGTEGSTLVQLKTHPKNFDLFKNCYSIVIDGIECRIAAPLLLRGLGNQSILIIIAFTTDKSEIDSGEVIKDYI